jgi:AI-2 transport protein TqsA
MDHKECAMNRDRVTVVLLGFLSLVTACAVLWVLKPVLLPFMIALFLSYIFKPVIIELTRRRVPSAVAVVVVLLLVLALLGAVSLVLTASAKSFISELPKYQARLEILLGQLQGVLVRIAGALGVPPSDVQLSGMLRADALTAFAASSLGSFVSFFSDLFLVLFFFLFIITGTGQLLRKIDYLFSDERSLRIADVFASIDRRVRQYMLTKTLISAVNGLLAAGLLALLGVDFPLLWGFVMFLMNFIPNIGSLFATFLPVLIAMLEFDTLTIPLLTLVLLIVSQNVMGNVIEPRVMAFSLDLSPLLIFASLIFWGWLWGIWGMILSVPIMAIIKIVCENVPALQPVAVLMGGKPPAKNAAEARA